VWRWTLQQFLKSSKYGEQFSGLQPGTPEFNAKWKDLAKSEPDFGDAQHSFIKSTHYDPALSGLKDAGIDLSGRSAAVQDAIWSSSVQFGAGNAKRGTGAIGMFKKALDGRDVATMSTSSALHLDGLAGHFDDQMHPVGRHRDAIEVQRAWRQRLQGRHVGAHLADERIRRVVGVRALQQRFGVLPVVGSKVAADRRVQPVPDRALDVG